MLARRDPGTQSLGFGGRERGVVGGWEVGWESFCSPLGGSRQKEGASEVVGMGYNLRGGSDGRPNFRGAKVRQVSIVVLLVGMIGVMTAVSRAQTTSGSASKDTLAGVVWRLSASKQAVVTTGAGEELPKGAGEAGGGASTRVELKVMPENPWEVQLVAPISHAVAKGETLHLTVWLRALEAKQETGDGAATLVFERAKEPYNKSLGQSVQVPREWKKFEFPFVADGDYGAGEAQVCIQLGQLAQTLEVSEARVRNHGKGVKPSDLPTTTLTSTYAGREATAAWRKQAAEMIEKNRKAVMSILVVDGKGALVRDARVAVRMKRHAYPFGSAVVAADLLAESPDAEKYRAIVLEHFNRVVMENDLKWGSWEKNRERSLAGLEWLKKNDVEVRGHVLVWPAYRWLPKDLPGLAEKPEALRERIDKRIEDAVAATRGKVVEWDVVNEPYANRDLMKVLGNEEMIRWFTLAHRANPDIRLFLNDYPILNTRRNAHLDHFEKAIGFLKDGGAPIGGIGVQCHYGNNVPSVSELWAGLERLAKMKLPIVATEFDIDTTDERFQADYLRDHLTAWFAHPGTDGFLMWGFWEGRHWRPRAALWRRDWSEKPAAKAFRELVLKEWWTNADLVTDESGSARVRGFLGRYAVTVTSGARRKEVTVGLGRETGVTRVVLD